MNANRRDVMWLFLGCGATFASSGARADTLPHMVVYRDPTCGCCHKWVEHMRSAGFDVSVKDGVQLKALKARLGVPAELASCHTGEIAGYVIEGHVPADAVKRLLAEKPKARGLAVAGMPVGSPGMEGPDPEIYDVMLFGGEEPKRYGRYREDRAI
jgi:hypothetical protein